MAVATKSAKDGGGIGEVETESLMENVYCLYFY